MNPNENDIFLVTQIPETLSAADFRRVFSQHIEAGVFTCFHYRRRPQSQFVFQLSSNPTCKELLSVLKRHRSSKSSFCTAIFIVNKQYTNQLLASFGESWATDEITGDYEACRLYPIQYMESESPRLNKLIELTPPNFMPRGNVGTTTAHFFNLIRTCQLSPHIIKRLHLMFPRGSHNRKYGNVPYDYSYLDHNYIFDDELQSSMGPLLEVHNPNGITFSNPVENDELAEEWDRFESLHDDPYNVDRSANHSLKYESKIELKWEKGGPGLVHYMDDMVWRRRESVRKDEFFDEPASFDWDIDTRQYSDGEEGFSGPGGPDHDAAQLLDIHGATTYRSEYAERVMRACGWRPGARLGRNAQRRGLLKPITAKDGWLSTQRSGFGFQQRKHRHRRPNPPPRSGGGVYLRSIFDSAETVAARSGEAHLVTNPRVRCDPALRVKYRSDWSAAVNRTVILTPHASRGFEGIQFLYRGLLDRK